MYKISNAIEEERIKECPFCGGTADIGICDYPFNSVAVCVKCETCGAEVSPTIIGQATYYEGRTNVYVSFYEGRTNVYVSLRTAVDKAIDKWNKRKSPCGTGIPTERQEKQSITL